MESLPHLRDVFPEHFSNNSSARPTPTNNAPLAKGNTIPHNSPSSNMWPTGHGPINHSNVANATPRQGAHNGGASRATAPSFSVLHSGTLDVVSTSYSVPTNSSWAAMQRLPAEGSSAANIPVQGTNPDRRRHVCPICSKPFERSSSLQTHMHIHTGERREDFQLNIHE
ncbi:hypothetical protein PLEOSDRAFT_160383 [Pleurotus ostreatus PC15]|uniref:C2H2-type domain-containing protein n=1 Tax=Pleurotus ostreatus (strain PC15) TaxID=1137138 RepID=A0A067NNU5_PLEO1|nr:hypothetical protein PLEOSDRAFT_160383 [Pleurotus ostreatus PC15]